MNARINQGLILTYSSDFFSDLPKSFRNEQEVSSELQKQAHPSGQACFQKIKSVCFGNLLLALRTISEEIHLLGNDTIARNGSDILVKGRE